MIQRPKTINYRKIKKKGNEHFWNMIGWVPASILLTRNEWLNIQNFIGDIHKQLAHKKKPNLTKIESATISIDMILSYALNKNQKFQRGTRCLTKR